MIRCVDADDSGGDDDDDEDADEGGKRLLLGCGCCEGAESSYRYDPLPPVCCEGPFCWE